MLALCCNHVWRVTRLIWRANKSRSSRDLEAKAESIIQGLALGLRNAIRFVVLYRFLILLRRLHQSTGRGTLFEAPAMKQSHVKVVISPCDCIASYKSSPWRSHHILHAQRYALIDPVDNEQKANRADGRPRGREADHKGGERELGNEVEDGMHDRQRLRWGLVNGGLYRRDRGGKNCYDRLYRRIRLTVPRLCILASPIVTPLTGQHQVCG